MSSKYRLYCVSAIEKCFSDVGAFGGGKVSSAYLANSESAYVCVCGGCCACSNIMNESLLISLDGKWITLNAGNRHHYIRII